MSRFGVEDLLELNRLGSCAVAPHGSYGIFEVTRHSIEENRASTALHRLDLSTGTTVPMDLDGKSNKSPVFSPDGQFLYFLSNRHDSTQIWSLDLASGDEVKLSDERDAIAGFHPTPDGTALLFIRIETPAGEAPSHHSANTLLFRHWDEWRDGKWNRLCRLDLNSGDVSVISPDGHDCPPLGLHGVRDFDVSPSADTMAFVYTPDTLAARGTNMSVFVGNWPPSGAAERVTESAACEFNPRFSPDGSFLAWQGMRRPGYEADRLEVWIRHQDTGETRSLTHALDRSVRTFQWSSDSQSILFDGDDKGRRTIYRVGLDGSEPEVLVQGPFVSLVAELDGGDLLVTQESVDAPSDLYRWSAQSGLSRLTDLNSDAGLESLKPAQDFWAEGADGDAVHGLLIPPHLREEGASVPLVVFIHGGPQGAFGDQFHYRWNPQVVAAAGYAVLLVNPRGSTGYGQAFCDQICQDWGGRVVEDIEKTIDHVLAQTPWLDGSRIGAAGGSFGGYMMNWLQGHSDRFSALVNHAGIFNLWNLYYGTEEVWFPEWEFGGAPHEDPTLYDKWSPCRFVQNWKTPMLILHGQLDYRVPYLEGVSAFTALQTRGIPSRIVLFPDEGHWINKPQNALTWYTEFVGFFDTHLNAT